MVQYTMKFNDELYRAMGEEADRRGVSLNDVVVDVVAKALGRPDLAFIPKKKMGRPRKHALATAAAE